MNAMHPGEILKQQCAAIDADAAVTVNQLKPDNFTFMCQRQIGRDKVEIGQPLLQGALRNQINLVVGVVPPDFTDIQRHRGRQMIVMPDHPDDFWNLRQIFLLRDQYNIIFLTRIIFRCPKESLLFSIP
nr:hypothetical protein [Pantoea agglomerans]